MSTYTIKFINSELIDNNEYTSLDESIESAKISSIIGGCDAVIKRDEDVAVVYIWHRYIDSNNVFHDTRIEYME